MPTDRRPADWRAGLTEVGVCPRCGVKIYVRGDAPAGPDGLPRPVYLCDCRLSPPPPPPAPAPPAPRPVVLPPVSLPPPACDHCYCLTAFGDTTPHAACCRCGARRAAAPISPGFTWATATRTDCVRRDVPWNGDAAGQVPHAAGQVPHAGGPVVGIPRPRGDA